jgi:hypothetical protein
MGEETLTTQGTAPRSLLAVSPHPHRLLSLFLLLGTSVAAAAAGRNLPQGGAGLPHLLASHDHRNTNGQTLNTHLQRKNMSGLSSPTFRRNLLAKNQAESSVCFILVASLVYSSIFKMQAARVPETSMSF